MHDTTATNITSPELPNHTTSNINNSSTIFDILKQNQEFKTLIIEQQKENYKLQQHLLAAMKDTTTINHNTINNNNNQKFNLNFFLNTTCKDAMNMSDFIEDIQINFKDIEDIGKDGYVSGMTNLILSRIRDLDITKRPLHCTDLKREIMYIKDNNEWCKDSPKNDKLRDMISRFSKRQTKYDLCFCSMHGRSKQSDQGGNSIEVEVKTAPEIRTKCHNLFYKKLM